MRKLILILSVFILLISFTFQADATRKVKQCEESQPTPIISIEPSVIVEPSEALELTPTASPSAVPTTQPQQASGGDGRSDGLSSCPECTKAPAVPAGPPATGRGKTQP